MGVDGKVAVVTGASSGIGLATARLLGSKGARVALVARSVVGLEEQAHKLPGSVAFPADLSDLTQVSTMVASVEKRFGTIDILVNNAGRGYDATIEKTDVRTLQEIANLDLFSPLAAMQAVIPIMEKHGGGSIVNVSSGTALMHLANMGGYAAVKAALAHLSLTARNELTRKHIAVSVVYPYITDTAFEENTVKGFVDYSLFESDRKIPQPDSAESVASLICKAIRTGQAELFAHPWMQD